MEELLNVLNATGIPFADAAWLEAPSGAYGVVQVNGMNGVYADDTLLDGYYTATADLYCVGHGRDLRKIVEKAMDTVPFVEWSFPSSEYLPDSNQTHWSWAVRLWHD